MKKFISMVMAAAMVVSLVPATAFAASGTAVFKTAGVEEFKEDAVKEGYVIEGSELQIAVKDLNAKSTTDDEWKITLDFDNLETKAAKGEDSWDGAFVARGGIDGNYATVGTVDGVTFTIEEVEKEATSLTVVIAETSENILPGDVIILPFGEDGYDNLVLTDDSEGTVATVTVSGKFGDSEALPLLTILAEGLDVTVAGKPVEVAVEEVVKLKKVTIEPTVGSFDSDDEIKVKLNKGFEFTKYPAAAFETGDDYFKVYGSAANNDGNIVFAADTIEIEAVSAKPGDIATLTVTCKGYESDSDEAAEVIADAVVMSVDEDEDVPVFYNGVNAEDWGLTADDDHKALEVTIEETVVDAWDTVKAWKLVLPEGVYAVEGTTVTGNGTFKSWKADTDKVSGPVNAFEEAYKDGNYKEFDFGRRAMVVNEKDKAKITLNLVLVAEPSFTGDVVLTLEGDALETQEVTIAKFVAPYTVEAAQNDMVIDYKETVVPTPVVITEAEAGLWADENAANGGATFALAVEKIEVEDADITVNEESEMEIDVDGESFVVEEESEDEVAVVTMDNVALYMQRAIPAGAYDLKLHTSMYDYFLAQPVFAQDAKEHIDFIGDVLDAAYDDKADAFCDTVTVKEGFVNVITAGRDQDDASFTKKVVVPVGAMEIVAGEDVVALDVPAYINAAGYTMLPVRAVAVALGINTNNVIWDQATKTVTILYGQRIITMTVGQKVINVNGSAIPASAAVEVVNGRTFLGLRDLATALGVVDITWDAATQTATLNGNN